MTTKRESYSSSSVPSPPTDVNFWVILSWHEGDSHYVTSPLGGEEGSDTAVTWFPPTDNGHPEAAVTRGIRRNGEWLSVWPSRPWSAASMRGYVTVMNCRELHLLNTHPNINQPALCGISLLGLPPAGLQRSCCVRGEPALPCTRRRKGARFV
ncbi:hypothetical protein D9C73_000376 [Collichthys lucidus]|uniref:Uncharacterized protein n=1 Tax=Collichthys lucidus TaxID=240159 RepID=A0A4U5TXU6_COLLU|nr:hypothetical protein D9C73_000376 [Collichthys lucidus]